MKRFFMTGMCFVLACALLLRDEKEAAKVKTLYDGNRRSSIVSPQQCSLRDPILSSMPIRSQEQPFRPQRVDQTALDRHQGILFQELNLDSLS